MGSLYGNNFILLSALFVYLNNIYRDADNKQIDKIPQELTSVCIYLYIQGANLIITVSSDVLAPDGARPSAGTSPTKTQLNSYHIILILMVASLALAQLYGFSLASEVTLPVVGKINSYQTTITRNKAWTACIFYIALYQSEWKL